MYFKKLELSGFKSFVEKTALIFEPGVTAIVGPNGTGKSNISDAIKWVLGEQSAKSMRGAKMEDVIFNGTETHPPLNMAEVSLTLSNEEKHLPIEYDEVTVTRRLYRSGESEYLLNKTLVRLKDIQELLMGTGIGTESYSLLEQGRIDAILSSKPDERRAVFEEASGITKYKKKKNEAMSKLQATEENLLRVNDIIVEVNRQLNSIQRQVNKARRYKEQFDELKTLDTQYTYREYTIVKTDKERLDAEENTYHQEQISIEDTITNLTGSFDVIKDTLSKVEGDFNQTNSKVINSSAQIEKNLHSVTINKERIEEFTQRAQDLCRDIDTAGRKIGELEEKLEVFHSKISAFQEDKNTKEHRLNLRQSSIAEIEHTIKIAHKESESNRMKAVNLLAEHAQIKNDLGKLSANIHNTNARLLRLHQEKEQTVQELDKVNTTISKKNIEIEDLKTRVDNEEIQTNSLQENFEELNQDIKDISSKIQTNKESLVGSQSQLDVLEKLTRSYEGFTHSVREFMLNKEKYPEMFVGVYDVLVNLIDVAPGYETAAETALGEYLQAVVVENKDVALRVRDFLAKKKIGKVRFLILDSAFDDQTPQFHQGGYRSMHEVVHAPAKYRELIKYLLSNTYIVEAKSVQKSNLNSEQSNVVQSVTAAHVRGPKLLENGVLFSCKNTQAHSVEVVGDFNDWVCSSETCMEKTDQGIWEKVLPIKQGTYRYKFVIDGKWIADIENPNQEMDYLGNVNSVLSVSLKKTAVQTNINLAEVVDQKTKLVNIDGEVHAFAQMVSRPHAEHETGLISQKMQMRHLKEECSRLEKSIAISQKEEEEKHQKLQTLKTKIKNMENILHEEKITLANRTSELSNVAVSKKKLDDEMAVVALEIDETTLDEQDLIEKESEKKERLAAIDQETQVNEQAMAKGQEIISLKTQEREDLLVVIAEMKTEFSHLTEQEESLNSNFSMLKQNLDEQYNNKADYIRGRDDSQNRSEELRACVQELESSTIILEQEKNLTQEHLKEISEKRTALLNEFEDIQNQIKQKENRLNFIKNNIRDLDVKKVEYNYKIETLQNNMRQYYKIDLTTLTVELPDENIEWQQQKEQIDILRAKIDRIGAVNLAAVEEEEELRERAEFLNSQSEDLLSAKQSLMLAIQKINKTTKSLFLETFEKTKVTFKEYFRLLFSGGDAQLFLTEGKDILESGVEIVVRPPGKRLQSITLLSGGEKTLTAIALLFAIFKIKPTPFCVLDEMDAPLDESNIDRFTRVLQEFLKSSQFIIITHNKKTIGMADVMYGVTMEKPGISKLVSVKFSEYKDLPSPVRESAAVI